MVRQPEQIKAFRDTWELGIHSYLAYLRDRLVVARDLLTETGSVFVQIGDENVHLVRNVLDEVFRSENFCGQIGFRTATGQPSNLLASLYDHILWFAKVKTQVKYRELFRDRDFLEKTGTFSWVELTDGTSRPLTAKERSGKAVLPDGKLFKDADLTTPLKEGEESHPVEFQAKTFYLPRNLKYIENIEKLIALNRIIVVGDRLCGKRYETDTPVLKFTNVWDDTMMGTFELTRSPKVYVVQTAPKVIQRCLLMTTDPGDLVLDPTCGSGTTAYVAEQWGRRWITIDTSRVALALARTRLMTAKYPYYKLKEAENVRFGFEYKTVPHVTLKSLANDEEPEQEVLYDQPYEDKNKVRVSGPFTVESLSPHRVSDAQEMLSSERFVETVVANLLKAGVQTGEKGARVEFVNLDILPGGPEVQASGEYKTKDGLKKVAVSIGPEFGSIDDDFIRDAAKVAKRFADLLVVAGTSFDASAFSVPAQVNGLQVMKVKINPDLSMGDLLKKTGVGNLFLAFGEPQIKVKETKDGITVEIVGVDVYDPVKGEIRSSGSGDPEHEIAAWFIDINYNGESFFVTHAYFLGEDKPYEKLKKALKADINEEAWEELYSTISRPFPPPKTGKIAVKVINHYGDEVMKIVEIK